ncbi:hypothetical protein ABBQ38_002671, partial [Trebouxia sp. C0009 RCD-2024]
MEILVALDGRASSTGFPVLFKGVLNLRQQAVAFQCPSFGPQDLRHSGASDSGDSAHCIDFAVLPTHSCH